MTWPTFKNILWLLSEMQTDIAEVAIYGYFPFLMCDVVNWIWGEQQMVVVASWWFQLQWGLESFMLHVEPSWFNFLSPFTLSLYHWDLIQIFDIPMHLLQNMQKGSQCNVGKLWQAWQRSMVLFCKGIVLRVWGKYWSILPGRHLLFMIGFHVGRQVSMDHLQKCTGIGNFHNACTWSKSGKPSIEKERLFSLITANIITSKVSNSAFCLLLDCIWMHCIHCILYKVHCIQLHCI